ncbi:MAG: ABC transporter substrate-binding protein [Planctomycetota bacterium]
MIASLLTLLLLAPLPLQAPGCASLEQLEQRFGKNVLVPDPAGLGPPEGVADDTVLQRHLGTEPKTLNAIVNNDGNLTDSLVAYVAFDLAQRHRDDPTRIAPGAADYASVTDDLRTVTVRLRRGLHWQFPAVDRTDERYAWLGDLFADGAPELTTDDIKFTHDLILDENTNTHLRDQLEGSSIEILDRYTFQVHWDRLFVYALDTSIFWEQILPRFLFSRDEDGRVFDPAEQGAAINTHWYNNRMCGYGPYEFISVDPGVEIVLRRKEDFHLFRPAIQEIHWQVTEDGEAWTLRTLEGSLDYMVLMAQQYRKYYLEAKDGTFLRSDRFRLKSYDKMNYIYLAWNNRRPPFDDHRVRNAMGLALNREAILEKILLGLGETVNSHVFYRHPHFNPGPGALPFDLDRASELLDQAGWEDENDDGVRDKVVEVVRDGRVAKDRVDLSFSILTFAGASELEAMLAVYQQDLRKIGVEMTPEPVTWGTMIDRAYNDREFDGFVGLINLGWNLDFYHAFHSQGASNYSGFSDPEADELIVRYRGTKDDEERRKMAFRIQEILFEQQPYTFFIRQRRMSVFPAWLENVHYAVARPQLLSFAWYRSK